MKKWLIEVIFCNFFGVVVPHGSMPIFCLIKCFNQTLGKGH
jgi:hypothetical protein